MIAVILVEDNFRDEEVFYPLFRLREAGWQVTLAGPEKREYKGRFGMTIITEIPVAELDYGQYDAVIVPGGWAPDKLRQNHDVLKLVKHMHDDKRIVAAICHGPWVLISAGIMRGKQATGYAAIKDDLMNAGAHYVDQEVAVAENVITSRTPEDLPAFMKAILNKK